LIGAHTEHVQTQTLEQATLAELQAIRRTLGVIQTILILMLVGAGFVGLLLVGELLS
jgi:hypothetical protein